MNTLKMKKTIALIGLLAFTNMAHAEDALETLSPKMSGLYHGVNTGVLMSSVNLLSNHPGFTELNGRCDLNSNYSGFTPGLQLGYIHRFGSRIMLGLEADFSYNTNQSTVLACACPTAPNVSDTYTFYNRMQGSIRGRMGYSFLDSRFFAFLTGGASFADLGLNYTNEKKNNYSTSIAATGALFGGGIEWKVSSAWSLRAEYHFVAYGTVDLRIPRIYALTDPNAAAHATSYANNLRLGVNYWFW